MALDSMNKLAEVLYSQGKYEEARASIKKAVDISLITPPPTCFFSLFIYYFLGFF